MAGMHWPAKSSGALSLFCNPSIYCTRKHERDFVLLKCFCLEMQWLLGGRRISRPGAEYEMAEVKKTTKYTELKLSKNVRAVYRCMEEETDIEI